MSRYALWSVFGPEGWAAWAMMVALVALLVRGPRAHAVARIAVGVALAWTLAMFVSPLGYELIELLEMRFPAPTNIAGTTDVLVLSGGEHLSASVRHHRPEYGETGDRMVAGAMLAHALPAARLWTVGGARTRPNTPRDIDWTREAWIRIGVDPSRIVMIGDTADTCANARGVAARLPPGARPLLVTSAFHMPRAVGCFRAAGVNAVPYPVDYVNGDGGLLDGPSPEFAVNAWRTDVALHEYIGLAWYRLTGRTVELWPGPQPRMRR